jgi:hypothetical protein
MIFFLALRLVVLLLAFRVMYTKFNYSCHEAMQKKKREGSAGLTNSSSQGLDVD